MKTNSLTRTTVLAFLVALMAIFSAGGVAIAQPTLNDIQPSVGLNKFDLFLQYLGRNGSGLSGPAYQRVSRAMARKAIIDARNIGVTYFRVSATGFAPTRHDETGDLELWQTDPQAYWAIFDTMMADLNAGGIRIVPVFVWNVLQFPAMTGHETVTNLIADSTSESYQLLENYITQFIKRYRNHPMLYFYELTNELSNQADIDLDSLWSYTQAAGNFSTDQLIAFTRRLTNLIRSLDSTHLISSGFALPRRSAYHLRRHPDWLPGGGDWTPDSLHQFVEHLLDINEPVDIVSIHFYNGIEDPLYPDSLRSNLRWGMTGAYNADLLDTVKAITDTAGKLLFVGEFADEDPTIIYDPTAQFSQNVLNKIVDLEIPFSAPWIWEFYQFVPYEFTDYNIEPGYTDFFIEKIKEANESLGNLVPMPPYPDTTPPQVVLVWPLAESLLDDTTDTVLVAAVASDDHSVTKVEFFVDQQLVHTAFTPPYRLPFDPSMLAAGEHYIKAVAIDSSGNEAADSVTVFRSVTTSVKSKDNPAKPRSFALAQNYPNPFNPSTTIAYQIPKTSRVTLTIYNLLGQTIKTLVHKQQVAGRYKVVWDGKDEKGQPVASGIYLYQLRAGDFVQIRKMTLLR